MPYCSGMLSVSPISVNCVSVCSAITDKCHHSRSCLHPAKCHAFCGTVQEYGSWALKCALVSHFNFAVENCKFPRGSIILLCFRRNKAMDLQTNCVLKPWKEVSKLSVELLISNIFIGVKLMLTGMTADVFILPKYA